MKYFLKLNKIDILLISETHFTKKYHFSIDGFRFYQTLHPDDKAHGGSAILIKNNIQHFESTHYATLCEIQATNVYVNDWIGPIQLSAIYSPPKHSIKKDDYEEFFETLSIFGWW